MVVALQAAFLVELEYSQTNNNADIELKIHTAISCANAHSIAVFIFRSIFLHCYELDIRYQRFCFD